MEAERLNLGGVTRMAGFIDVHVLDMTGCETDSALAEMAGNKVLMIHSGVTMLRYSEILTEMLTTDELACAWYHGAAGRTFRSSTHRKAG